jgi:hypothetical protein
MLINLVAINVENRIIVYNIFLLAPPTKKPRLITRVLNIK